MSSIVTAAFKATFGLLVNKVRDKAAERLKEGDVTDKRIRELIAREIDDVKSKLDALSEKDLEAAIDAFEAGVRYLYQAVDAEPSSTGPGNTVALASEMRNMELTEFGEKFRKALSQGKERFKMAREEATRAFNNKALSTSDRITAIRYRVMAALLESATETMSTSRNFSSLSLKDVLENAMPECEQCLHKLHSLPDVQNVFKVELKKGLLNIRGRFGKDERREIISAVCQVNRTTYDAMEAVGKDTHVCIWPSIDTGEDKIDALRDRRVSEVLQKVGVKQYSAVRSFGKEGEEEHKLKEPLGIATNKDGQVVIADNGDKTIKVFDFSGHFILKISPNADDGETKLVRVWDVATDEEGNIYAMVRLTETGSEREETKLTDQVLVFNSAGKQLRKFPVKRKGYGDRLTVSRSKVLVAWCRGVAVYELDGGYVRSIGEEELKDARDITAGPDGRLLVLDREDQCIHVFTEDGQQLNKFSVQTEEGSYFRVACHPGGEHVIVAGCERRTDRLCVPVYTKDGECQRTVKLDQRGPIGGFTVSMEGRICVADHHKGKVIVL